jgi:hypothetical protein
VIFTYEMTPGHSGARQAGPVLGVSSASYRRGERDPSEIVAALPSSIFYVHRCPLDRVRDVIARVSDQYGAGPLVVFDYAQKMIALEMTRHERPDARYAAGLVSEALTSMMQACAIPGIVVSANNRSGSAKTRGKNGRGPRDMAPSELVDVSRESSDIEYDAPCFVSLHVTDDELHADDGTRVGTMTVAKSRHGTVGHIDMGYDGARGLWIDRGPVARKPSRADKQSVMQAQIIASLRGIASPVSFRALIGKGNVDGKPRERRVEGNEEEIKQTAAAMALDGKITITATGRYSLDREAA